MNFGSLTERGNVKDIFLTVDIIYGTTKSVASLLDITERKKAEETLKKRMKELEIFNDATVDREIMLNEARKEINDLLDKLGKEPKYKIAE